MPHTTGRPNIPPIETRYLDAIAARDAEILRPKPSPAVLTAAEIVIKLLGPNLPHPPSYYQNPQD